jgi:hypothetical protein
MAIVQQSATARFILKYDDQISSAQQTAQTLSQTIEHDFLFLRKYLPFDELSSPDFFEKNPTNVVLINAGSKTALGASDAAAKNIPNPGGGFNFKNGDAGTIWMNASGATGQPLTPDYARFVFIAEMSEQLMSNFGWVLNNSRGEALSRALAEEFFPNAPYQPECISLAPWVNSWLNSLPRFDYINQTPGPTPSNKLFGSDQDLNGFGCCLLFINYLRFQLGYTLEAISQTNGSTLAEQYNTLTGRTDNPLVAMNNLLASHFNGFTYGLLNNNPFPLYDKTARSVELGFSSTLKAVPAAIRVSGSVAHVRPFFMCPAKDYSYDVSFRAVTWTVTATVEGFGTPQFRWSINGTQLFSSSGAQAETLSYAVPDPNNPQVPKKASGVAHFSWSFSNVFTRTATQSVLTITNASFEGVYNLGISVSVQEALVADTPTDVPATLTFEAEKVVYEPSYYSDGIKCETRFITEFPQLLKTINDIPRAPDPNPQYDLSQIIRAVDGIRAELKHIGEVNPKLGVQATKYAATRLQVEPGLLSGKRELPG